MSRFALDLQVGTPMVLRGIKLSIGPTNRYAARIYAFECDHGSVRVWLDMEAVEGFEFREQPEPAVEESAEEGEMLLF